MKMFILVAISIFSNLVFATAVFEPTVKSKVEKVAIGKGFKCALLDNKNARCWGDNMDNVFTDVEDIMAVESHACITYKDVIKCFGSYWSDAVSIKSSSIIEANMGRRHVCLRDLDGVWCESDYTSYNVPYLKNPKKLISTPRSVCVVEEDNSLVCWGEDRYTVKIPEDVTYVKEIYSGSGSVCVTTKQDRLRCWGIFLNVDVQLKQPIDISIGQNYVCAIDDDGLKCYGSTSMLYLNDAPTFKKPRRIFAMDSNVLVVDDEGLKCFGRNSHRQCSIPVDPADIKEVTVYESTSCVIVDGKLSCWGLYPDIPENLHD